MPDEFIVTEEFAKLALEIPAAPDKLEFVSPEIVLLPAAIVLFVKVWIPVNVATTAGSIAKVKPAPSDPPSPPVIPVPFVIVAT